MSPTYRNLTTLSRNALSRGQENENHGRYLCVGIGPVRHYLPALQPARQVRRRYIEAL